MSEENVEAVRAIYAEWAHGNLGAGLTLYDPDLVFMAPDEGRVTGIQEAQTWMRRWLEAWDNFTITAREVIPAGDSVFVAVQEHGVGKESGIPMERSYFAVWTFRGPSVIRLEQMWDRAAALEAIGLSE
jgi:ketosteroid isomerase-like protein